METYPAFKMYAVVKDGVVIDCAFSDDAETYYSPITKTQLNIDDSFLLYEMTKENSPAQIGTLWDKGKEG